MTIREEGLIVKDQVYLLSRYLWAVRPPSQNSVKAKKLGGVGLPVKARLVRAIKDIKKGRGVFS